MDKVKLHHFTTFAALAVITAFTAALQPTEPKIRALLQDHKNGVEAMAFSPDSKLLVVGCAGPDQGLKIWDIAAVKCVKIFDGFSGGGVSSVAFSPDGKCPALAPWGGPASIYEVATWTKGRSFETPKKGVFQYMRSLAFTPDSNALLTIDQHREIALWSVAAGEKISTIPHELNGGVRMAFSPDGKNVALGGFGKLFVWNLADKKVRWQLKAQEGALNCLAFSSDSKPLVSAGMNHGTPGGIEAVVWEMENGKRKHTLDTSKSFSLVFSAGFSRDSKILAMGGNNNFGLWNVATGQHIRRVDLDAKPLAIPCIEFSADGRTMAVAMSNGNVALFDTPKE